MNQDFEEIYLNDLLRYQECPQKRMLISELGIRSKDEAAKSVMYRHLQLMVKDCVSGEVKRHAFYSSRMYKEIEKTLGPDNVKRLSDYKTRSDRIFATMLNRYVYGKTPVMHISIPGGMTEYGLRVITTADFSYTETRWAGVSLCLVDFTKGTYTHQFNSSLLRATVIHEHNLRNGMTVPIRIHNVIKDEYINYNSDRMHENLARTLRMIMSRFKAGDRYYNIGSWCSYCQCLNNCYGTIIR